MLSGIKFGLEVIAAIVALYLLIYAFVNIMWFGPVWATQLVCAVIGAAVFIAGCALVGAAFGF